MRVLHGLLVFRIGFMGVRVFAVLVILFLFPEKHGGSINIGSGGIGHLRFGMGMRGGAVFVVFTLRMGMALTASRKSEYDKKE